jgi:hypothetical protein
VLTATVYGLRRADLTYSDSTKDAVVWAVVVGLPLLFNAHGKRGAPGLLRATLVGAVALTALVEFFVNLYVLPIWVEVVLQPVVVLLVLLGAMLETCGSGCGVGHASGRTFPVIE